MARIVQIEFEIAERRTADLAVPDDADDRQVTQLARQYATTNGAGTVTARYLVAGPHWTEHAEGGGTRFGGVIR